MFAAATGEVRRQGRRMQSPQSSGGEGEDGDGGRGVEVVGVFVARTLGGRCSDGWAGSR